MESRIGRETLKIKWWEIISWSQISYSKENPQREGNSNPEIIVRSWEGIWIIQWEDILFGE